MSTLYIYEFSRRNVYFFFNMLTHFLAKGFEVGCIVSLGEIQLFLRNWFELRANKMCISYNRVSIVVLYLILTYSLYSWVGREVWRLTRLTSHTLVVWISLNLYGSWICMKSLQENRRCFLASYMVIVSYITGSLSD